ncbi:hypothetical protein ACVCK3_04475 [Bacillus cereus]
MENSDETEIVSKIVFTENDGKDVLRRIKSWKNQYKLRENRFEYGYISLKDDYKVLNSPDFDFENQEIPKNIIFTDPRCDYFLCVECLNKCIKKPIDKILFFNKL